MIKKRLDPIGFQSLYQGDPRPKEGLMYTYFRTYQKIPHDLKFIRKNYTDTADTGADFLFSVCYVETSSGCYITDMVYTDKPMEYTEPTVAEMLTDNQTNFTLIESNNGGRGFARAVEHQCRQLRNTQTRISWFHQSANKQARINTASAAVQNIIFFPEGWEKRWPEVARAAKSYRRDGGNTHDDIPDVLTGIVEHFGKGGSNVKDSDIVKSFV